MGHGGKRTGAGRPKGSGKYREPTRIMRIPESLLAQVSDYVSSKGFLLPLYGNSVPAGFPSPADDHIEMELDLNSYLIEHPASTFLVRVSGESMRDAGIFPGDILVVDRSLEPVNGKVVIVALDGELTVKRLKILESGIMLMPENPAFQPIQISDDQTVNIWGVVTNVIHKV